MDGYIRGDECNPTTPHIINQGQGQGTIDRRGVCVRLDVVRLCRRLVLQLQRQQTKPLARAFCICESVDHRSPRDQSLPDVIHGLPRETISWRERQCAKGMTRRNAEEKNQRHALFVFSGAEISQTPGSFLLGYLEFQHSDTRRRKGNNKKSPGCCAASQGSRSCGGGVIEDKKTRSTSLLDLCWTLRAPKGFGQCLSAPEQSAVTEQSSSPCTYM